MWWYVREKERGRERKKKKQNNANQFLKKDVGFKRIEIKIKIRFNYFYCKIYFRLYKLSFAHLI